MIRPIDAASQKQAEELFPCGGGCETMNWPSGYWPHHFHCLAREQPRVAQALSDLRATLLAALGLGDGG